MADTYVSETYVENALGANYVAAVAAALDLDQVREAATAVVQVAMRNSGYTAGADTDGATVEEFVKLATLGALQEMIASSPEVSIPLPANWETNPNKMAFQQIVDGTAALAGTPSQIGGVGGMKMTSADPDDPNGIPRRTTRTNMQGY